MDSRGGSFGGGSGGSGGFGGESGGVSGGVSGVSGGSGGFGGESGGVSGGVSGVSGESGGVSGVSGESGAIVVDRSVKMWRTFPHDFPQRVKCGLTCEHHVVPQLLVDRDIIGGVLQVEYAPERSPEYPYELPGTNGLCSAFMLAYNQHLPLRLAPDVLWITILQSLATWLNSNGNAEKYRAVFVAHTDVKELAVMVPPAWERDPTLVEWDAVLLQLQSMASGQCNMDIAAAFKPEFSTTTLASVTACAVVALAATKAYFTYGMQTKCGIGEVHLDGTVDDWTALQAKVAHVQVVLRAAGEHLHPWFERLNGTLGMLAQTARTRVGDLDFWQHAFSKKVTRGSGRGTYLSGWFLHFFLPSPTPYDSVRLEQLPSGFATVPFFWRFLSGKKRKYLLCAGSWNAYVDASGVVTAKPEYAVLKRNEAATDDDFVTAEPGSDAEDTWPSAVTQFFNVAATPPVIVERVTAEFASQIRPAPW